MHPPLMRSKLFVPGSRPAWFDKALAGPADAVSFDLEDAVAEAQKESARAALAAFLALDSTRLAGKTLVVRTNPLHSPHFQADLAAALAPGVHLINLPKVGSAAEVLQAVALLEQAEAARRLAPDIQLLLNIETPAALRRAAEIGGAHARVAGLQLGLGDLFEPLGIDRRDARNVHAVMASLRLAAGEAGVWACDTAYPDIADSAGFSNEARMARRLGYIGKSCIHPGQVTLANQVFQPGSDEIARAQRVVEAAEEARAAGQGACQVDGRMVDAPYLQHAQAVLALAARAGSAPADGSGPPR